VTASRVRDILYCSVSVSFGVVFFFLSFSDLAGYGTDMFYSPSWEVIPFLLLGAFLFGGGIYAFMKTVRMKQQEDQNARREILTMLILVVVLLVAVWTLLHFGLG
jgi:hypothetical protein